MTSKHRSPVLLQTKSKASSVAKAPTETKKRRRSVSLSSSSSQKKQKRSVSPNRSAVVSSNRKYQDPEYTETTRPATQEEVADLNNYVPGPRLDLNKKSRSAKAKAAAKAAAVAKAPAVAKPQPKLLSYASVAERRQDKAVSVYESGVHTLFIFDITANEITISNFVSLVSFVFGLCEHRFQSENAFFDLGAPNCRALDSVPHDDGYITTLSFN